MQAAVFHACFRYFGSQMIHMNKDVVHVFRERLVEFALMIIGTQRCRKYGYDIVDPNFRQMVQKSVSTALRNIRGYERVRSGSDNMDEDQLVQWKARYMKQKLKVLSITVLLN